MTRVCLVGDPDVHLQYELLSRETARDALASYDLREPFQNSIAVETVSLGAAVSLLNDLQWYLVRFVEEAMVLEPSVSDEEWLSRDLAIAIRDSEQDAAKSGRFLKVYGLVSESSEAGEHAARSGDGSVDTPQDEPGADSDDETADSPDDESADIRDDESADIRDDESDGDGKTAVPRLVEPMYVTRTGDSLPEYDLRDVSDTVLVRVTESEFEQ